MNQISQSDLLLFWQHRNAWLLSFLTFSYSATSAVVMVSTSTATLMTSNSTSPQKPLLHCTLTHCLTEIKLWIKLPSNLWKTALRLIFPKPLRRTTHNSHNSLFFHNTSLASSSHLRKQGIILDSRLLLQHHTNHITKNISFHLEYITSLRPPLFFSTNETLIDTFIWSRLD